MNKSIFNRAVLIAVLVLPALLYIIFVYGQSEVFFQTLDYVGPKQAVENEGATDTVAYRIPDFEFYDTDSNAVRRETLDSTLYVLSFFFATCPSICPAMNFHLNEVERRFKGYDQFKMVSITVDPSKDTPEALKAYQRVNNYNQDKWLFLTGDQSHIYDFAKGVYLNAFEDQTAEGGFLHSTSVVLVDWDGHIRSRTDEFGNIIGSYDVLEVTKLKELEEDIKILIAEYERDKHNAKDGKSTN
jgi:protein SCO1/2